MLKQEFAIAERVKLKILDSFYLPKFRFTHKWRAVLHPFPCPSAPAFKLFELLHVVAQKTSFVMGEVSADLRDPVLELCLVLHRQCMEGLGVAEEEVTPAQVKSALLLDRLAFEILFHRNFGVDHLGLL